MIFSDCSEMTRNQIMIYYWIFLVLIWRISKNLLKYYDNLLNYYFFPPNYKQFLIGAKSVAFSLNGRRTVLLLFYFLFLHSDVLLKNFFGSQELLLKPHNYDFDLNFYRQLFKVEIKTWQFRRKKRNYKKWFVSLRRLSHLSSKKDVFPQVDW